MLISWNNEYIDEIYTALGKSQEGNYIVYDIQQKGQMFSNQSTLYASGCYMYHQV